MVTDRLEPINITMPTVLVGVGHAIFRPTSAKAPRDRGEPLGTDPYCTVKLSGPALKAWGDRKPEGNCCLFVAFRLPIPPGHAPRSKSPCRAVPSPIDTQSSCCAAD